MRILLINPPHTSIGSRIPNEHLPPLGLLCIGGPLIDDGHTVRLLDAEFGPMRLKKIIQKTIEFSPDAVLLGHSGSTSAQPVISKITKLIREKLPSAHIIIGGVYPTYHWKEILMDEPQVDIIVRGEGEEIARQLIRALETNSPLEKVDGIACRKENTPFETHAAKVIQDLDMYRVGWELMGTNKYTYWGKKKAVVVQFSRGCPYPCNYCGQSLFWKKWRHRNPKKLAAELAMLHREYGIEVINFADENPTTSKEMWVEFLNALIAENVKLILVGSTRADNIFRDADILHLYKKAGFERFLLGIENYDEVTLDNIKKAGTVEKDREAIKLLRKNDILSMATYVVGFAEETHKDYLRGLKQFLAYDPDQIQMLYVTPHRWTPFYNMVKEKNIIQPDLRKWDYKHQVLASQNLKPWMVLAWVKLIEVIAQMRPKSVMRVLFHRDKSIRAAMRWYYNIGRKVWFYEIWCYFFRDVHLAAGPKLKEFWEPKKVIKLSEGNIIDQPDTSHFYSNARA